MRELLIPQPTEQNPVEVEDYPYGWSQRTKAQWWIETTKRGQRVVFRTLNPKTGRWNKPKKSTYSDIGILTKNTENDHIENDGLSFSYADEDDLQAFLKQFPEENFSEYQKEKLKDFRAIIKTRKHIHMTCVDNPTPERAKEIEANNEKTNAELCQIYNHYRHQEE